MSISIDVNGKLYEADDEAELSEVLRSCGFLSVKDGCSERCTSSCLVEVDGVFVPSCKWPVAFVRGKKIVTLEAIKKREEGKCVLKAFEKASLTLCEFCESAVFFSILLILRKHDCVSREEVLSRLSHLKPCCASREVLLRATMYALEFSMKSGRRK